MAKRIRHTGAIMSGDANDSYTDTTGAYMDCDGAGYAQFGGMASASGSLGLKLRTMLAGVVITALTIAASGDITIGSATSVTNVLGRFVVVGGSGQAAHAIRANNESTTLHVQNLNASSYSEVLTKSYDSPVDSDFIGAGFGYGNGVLGDHAFAGAAYIDAYNFDSGFMPLRFIQSAVAGHYLRGEFDAAGGFVVYNRNAVYNSQTVAFMVSPAHNLGQAVTPATWHSSYEGYVFQQGPGAALFSGSVSALHLSTNYHIPTGGTDNFLGTGRAADLWMDAGTITLRLSNASGVADGAITWINAVTVTTDGVGVGVTPKTWHANYQKNVLQVGAGSALFSSDITTTLIGANYYVRSVAGVATDSFIGTGSAANIYLASGAITLRVSTASGVADGAITWVNALQIGAAGGLGFNGTSAIAKPTVTGSRGSNAALASVLTALANYGLITDSSS